MRTFISKATLLYLLLSTTTALANKQDQVAISLAFTFSMPPYLSQDKKSGIERDIIYSALTQAGYESISIENVHYLRAIELVKSGSIDAIVSNQSNTIYSSNLPGISTSHKTLDYVDCAISLASQNLQLKTIYDYYDKHIWAFKSASTTLGQDFQLMTQNNKKYTEDVDQLKQLDMLAMKRIDIAISDRNIFSSKHKNSRKYQSLEFSFDNIAPPTSRVIRSMDRTLIQKFNKGLEGIQGNGEYQAILSKYRDSYAGTCE